MRKTLLVAFGLILAALLSTSAISPAQAHIEDWVWLPPYLIRGYDDMFYHEYIVGYEAGSTATLNVLVENDRLPSIIMNVSAVKIGFDWYINYTSGEPSEVVPIQLAYGETHTFRISFTVPNTSVASNMWAHTYKVYVEWVNATGGLIGSWVRNWDEKPGSPDYKFVVYSADQSDTVESYYEYQSLYSSYPPYYFDNVNAQLLATQAGTQATMGLLLYTRGDFAGAETKVQTALDLYDQALTIEGDWGTTYQYAELNVTKMQAEALLLEASASQTQAQAALKEADAALIIANVTVMQSYAWLLFGVAAMLFGVAAVVYAIKKPKI